MDAEMDDPQGQNAPAPGPGAPPQAGENGAEPRTRGGTRSSAQSPKRTRPEASGAASRTNQAPPDQAGAPGAPAQAGATIEDTAITVVPAPASPAPLPQVAAAPSEAPQIGGPVTEAPPPNEAAGKLQPGSAQVPGLQQLTGGTPGRAVTEAPLASEGNGKAQPLAGQVPSRQQLAAAAAGRAATEAPPASRATGKAQPGSAQAPSGRQVAGSPPARPWGVGRAAYEAWAESGEASLRALLGVQSAAFAGGLALLDAAHKNNRVLAGQWSILVRQAQQAALATWQAGLQMAGIADALRGEERR